MGLSPLTLGLLAMLLATAALGWWIRRGLISGGRIAPAAATGLATALALGLTVTGLLLLSIFSADSSTAVVALYGVPVAAGLAALAGGLLGWALHHLLGRWSRAGRRALALAALLAVVGGAAWMERSRELERRSADPAAGTEELRQAMDRGIAQRDRWALLGLAENPATPPSLLQELARRDEPWLHEPPASGWRLWLHGDLRSIHQVVASRPETPAAALELLARSPEASVREAVAANSSAPPSALEQLNGDPSPQVLRAVARNPATPEGLLGALAHHDDRWVRFSVGRNPQAPLEVLAELARDPDLEVRDAVRHNPRASDLSTFDSDEARP
ncbi:MAG: hypothetical protein SX243_12345 [Acidobacteriota bacterium]|nr:hypothetical protein [Acidobacteriota bacterium]